MSEQAIGELVLEKSVIVNAPVERAFHLYTEEIASWWPLATHSFAKEQAVSVVFEPGPGGRILERDADGVEHLWGTVLEWDPPHRFVHTWHPGRGEESAQQVEMRFTREGDGTLVELEHRGWDMLGEDAVKVFENYDSGWDYVLSDRYAEAANS
jgi:uncharacterized protein YndB with AHSA1/START domain